MWRFKGSPNYLDKHAARLGITQVLADRARTNAEIYRVAVLCSQLAGRYHGAPKENGVPKFSAASLAQIRGTLDQCRLEHQKLQIITAATSEMIDDACEAFGIARSDQ